MDWLQHANFTLSFFYLVFAFHLFFMNRKTEYIRFSSLLFFLFGIFSLCLYVIGEENINIKSLTWIVHLGSITNFGIGLVVMLALMSYSQLLTNKRKSWLYPIIISAFFLVIIAQLSGLLAFPDHYNQSKGQWIIAYRNFTLTIIFNIIYYTSILTGMAIVFLYSYSKRIESRSQGLVVVWSGFFTFLFALGCFLLSEKSGTSVPNISNFFYLIITGGIVYASRKYEFLEITSSTINKKVLEIIPEGLFLTDREGRIKYINPELTRLYGYNEDYLFQKSYTTLFNDVFDREKFRKLLTEKGQIIDEELKIITAGGTYIPVLFSAAVIQYRDEALGMVGIIKNIARLKKTEYELINHKKQLEDMVAKSTEELVEINKLLQEKIIESIEHEKKLELEKEKAEESDRLKSAFLSNMSHEIRTPMNGIMGFSTMLQNSGISDEKRQHYINIINECCEQLINIVDDILIISQIDAHQMVIKKREISVDEFFNQIDAQIHDRLRSSKVHFKVNYPVVQGRKLYTDREKLEQIFMKLIDNALKFTSKGMICIGCGENHEEMVFYVKDSGIGISPENHELIFDKFRQVETSISRKYGGMGLGLSIAKSYTQALGGKIWVDSNPGKGSTFYFSIPRINNNGLEELNISIDDLSTTNLENMRILVVEDEEANFLYLNELLSDLNAEIVHAMNGREGVEMARSNDYDLILMDINMPVMDGIEATRRIRKFNQTVPIIAQTAYNSSENMNDAKAAGCNDVLVKPLSSIKVVKLIISHQQKKKTV